MSAPVPLRSDIDAIALRKLAQSSPSIIQFAGLKGYRWALAARSAVASKGTSSLRLSTVESFAKANFG
ncbi:MAG: hypothetical protein DLM68_14730 [Hyphomicrobiales bacterium]|nr:MAG: hypothetical protein DLM68_14730 [Hyphomicrobiales bacterium]